ncbi:MAG: hypothetical protein ACE5KG_07355 [Nitrososphaerales archaeon]
MSSLSSGILVGALLAIIVFIMIGPPIHDSRAADELKGSVNVTKGVVDVTLEGRVILHILVVNNGSLPVDNLEIYDFFQQNILDIADSTLIFDGKEQEILPLMGPASTGSISSQVIFVLPPKMTIFPGETAIIRYTVGTPGEGSYFVPPALVWYSFDTGSSSSRTFIYTNGVNVEIPTYLLRLLIVLFPYILAITSFTFMTYIIFWARKQFKRTEEKLSD